MGVVMMWPGLRRKNGELAAPKMAILLASVPLAVK